MAYLGTLVEWNDQCGFGFIQADEGGERIFVHISAFQPRPSSQTRPFEGQRLKFAIGMDHGKKRAHQVLWRNVQRTASPIDHSNSKSPAKPPVRTGGAQYFVVLAFIFLFIAVALFWVVPRWVASLYMVMSLITFFAYWKDKAAAQAGRWRTPESTLHCLTLIGGWPGAILAQQWLRHKSSKAPFRTVFWCTVVVNVSVFVWLHSPWARDWFPMLRS